MVEPLCSVRWRPGPGRSSGASSYISKKQIPKTPVGGCLFKQYIQGITWTNMLGAGVGGISLVASPVQGCCLEAWPLLSWKLDAQIIGGGARRKKASCWPPWMQGPGTLCVTETGCLLCVWPLVSLFLTWEGAPPVPRRRAAPGALVSGRTVGAPVGSHQVRK